MEDISVITNTEETALRWKNESDVDVFYGGYVKVLPESANPFDLVIVATPLHELRPAASEAVKFGNKNILVEKPTGLYSGSLEEWRRQIPEDVRIRIAYNRLVYPSLWKLKDIICRNEEKITSCFYTFTEWPHTIYFDNNKPECYQRWGIVNSLHVISMAHSLTGLPVELSAQRWGRFHGTRRGHSLQGLAGPNEILFFPIMRIGNRRAGGGLR